jgi:hypothetical protein
MLLLEDQVVVDMFRRQVDLLQQVLLELVFQVKDIRAELELLFLLQDLNKDMVEAAAVLAQQEHQEALILLEALVDLDFLQQ